jgi:hypothetical protein
LGDILFAIVTVSTRFVDFFSMTSLSYRGCDAVCLSATRHQSSQERRANISQPLLSHERRAQLMMRLTIFKGNRQDKVEQVTSSFIMENKPSRPSHQERT